MMRRASIAATTLLLAALAGCQHKAPVQAPPPPPAPTPITPATITVITPLPSVPTQSTPKVTQAAPTPPPAVPVKAPVHHRRKRHPNTETASAGTTGQAAAGSTGSNEAQGAGAPVPSEQVPALGQLSTGTAISDRERGRLLQDIESQETRLKKQPAPQTADSRTELTQVETFLAKARQAVDQNDLDGASTLTTKARVLLDEVEKQ